MECYVEISKSFDATEYLPRCSNVRLFFQFGSGDEVVSENEMKAFSPYLCEGDQLKIYESASHYEMFLNPDARQDRLCWLREQLRG